MTAIAAIFIASKLLQVNHVNLAFCHSNIGHGKFSHRQITERETDMMELVGWEVTQPLSTFQVFELLTFMLKKRLHGSPRLNERAIEEACTLGLSLIRASLCSLEHLRKSKVETAHAALVIALEYCIPQQERHLVLSAWSDIKRFSQGSHQAELLADLLRLRDLMVCPASGQTRIKEIMVFPAEFLQWAARVRPPLFFGSRVAAFDAELSL